MMATERDEDALMKMTVAAVLLAAVWLMAAGPAVEEKLTPELERWLEDVGPILTKTERSVFLKLQTNVDRAKFIRLFWRMRDPYPDTSENEFQKEYEERVRFADQNFGRSTSKRGSQTDRGFFHLVLGPPVERTLFTTHSQVWPMELWLYQGAEEYGLPGHFYLIFYQPEGLGDYRLYSPTIEGPEKLVLPTVVRGGVGLDRSAAFNAIRAVSAELAGASLSYLPSDTSGGTASFSSDMIVATVRGLPEKKFSSAYARSYLTYKDRVETEYLDRYFPCAFQIGVFQESGQSFLHWSIEPEKMDFGSQGDSIYASFELVLRIEDGGGRPLYEKTEEIPLRITAQQFQENARRRFAFQDLLAVVPGEHKALFLLKNKTARSFSSFEAHFSVPPSGRQKLGRPLLYYGRSPVPEAQRTNLKAFAFGGQQYLVGARNEFPASSTLGVFVQASGVDASASPPSFVLDLVPLEMDKSVGTFPLTEIRPDARDGKALLVSGSVPLKDVAPGYYRAEVSLVSGDGRALATEKENFIVLAGPAPVVPWVYARLHGPFPGPEHLKTLGAQYFLAGDYGQARQAMERSLGMRDDVEARLLLAKSLYGLGLFQEALSEASRVRDRAQDRESAKVMALCHAGLKEWAPALVILEELLASATEIPVLNLAAEGYLALGQPDKALPLIQRSLSLVPDQPAVKAMEEQARKR